MASVPVENWKIEKTVARAAGGVVAAQSAPAAAVGAEVLADGGNAIDAAVATALALSVTEPWMSGLGGCGYLVTYQAASGSVEVIDFGTAAPARLDPSAFPLAEEGLPDSDLFGWPRVAGDRNVQGPMSIGLPGSVAGLGLAQESFGRLPWRSVVQPALALARQGHVVDWWSTLKIAGAAASLRLFEGTSRIYLPGGLTPAASELARSGRGSNHMTPLLSRTPVLGDITLEPKTESNVLVSATKLPSPSATDR